MSSYFAFPAVPSVLPAAIQLLPRQRWEICISAFSQMTALFKRADYLALLFSSSRGKDSKARAVCSCITSGLSQTSAFVRQIA